MDPWEALGLERGAATAGSVRQARRRLAKLHHPDVVAGSGGGAAQVAAASARLVVVNQAAELALADLANRPPEPDGPTATAATTPADGDERADAVFSLDLLPVDAFEVVLLAFSCIGDPKVVDEPYLLEGQVDVPYLGAARVELAPEAGGSLVTVTTWPLSRAPTPAPTALQVAGRLLWEIENLDGP